ncbi:helix-turn-helix domain-containing protein [Pseudomonas guariconensis]|uniref:helix-turn-helix domain-containing protein n=1 Tax=Pseudomonas TaxID=286 RepID=UPI0020968D73|nr:MULTISPECIES: helix-turn-helix domain-containing protein [Pseudomonas]MCO7641139.1 helix-turn-helix domain-containing protein [Pseudomonas sp. S 311-6]MCO7515421.1 helix-turn-helix domain-containing protein [Pseudomonas putida]MCO7566504.1 helix-turn-helix domain-containing protein [Pseudomonas mosselii]MCO7596514.1 helix-turn-helix domain-containing protein [Pseudomonas guariconensis]MCO7605436.1 helix-turn-helix domain-containing protein [Pseudomonas guariconensis]
MNSISKPSFKPVEAVARALKVLRVVNEEKQATVASIHRQTGLDKATIVRMLETLHHEGYVSKDPERAVYSVTARTLLLSQGYDKSRWVANIAEPTLARFRNAIGWPSDIALFDYDAMVVVQTSRGSGPLSFNRQPGFRSPMLVTSIGIAYLAFCEREEREAIIQRLAATPEEWNQLAHQPAKLEELLEKVRQDGFAVMSDAYSSNVFAGNVWAIGVPVMHEGKLYATMNIMMLKSAVDLDSARENLLAPLQEAAAEIAYNLAESKRHR